MPDPTRHQKRVILKGDVPSPIDPPPGCRFHTRCPFAESLCTTNEPVLREINAGHQAACHFAGTVGL
jgi:oligopeptide/dipeptide ABC transporter ATP-binding protein